MVLMSVFCLYLTECAVRIRAEQAGAGSRVRRVAASDRRGRHSERGVTAEEPDQDAEGRHREAAHLTITMMSPPVVHVVEKFYGALLLPPLTQSLACLLCCALPCRS